MRFADHIHLTACGRGAGRNPLSAFLHGPLENWQKPAQNSRAPRLPLARGRACSTVTRTRGANLAAPFVYHLFRTLCLNGQVRGFSRDLPVFFDARRKRLNRQAFAHRPNFCLPRLQVLPFGSLRAATNNLKNEGWAGCEYHGFWRHWDCVRDWPHAETPRWNRRSMAAARAWSDRPCWTVTSSLAQLSELRQTSSIARKIPASARRGLAGPDRNNRPLSGPITTLRNATWGALTPGGVLRSEHQGQRTAHV